MAALGGAARRAIGASILRSLPLSPSLSSRFPPAVTLTATFARLPRLKLPSGISRLPVELGCAQSLMPLHSVTALALLNSMLSVKPGGWSWLSEGFTLPL